MQNKKEHIQDSSIELIFKQLCEDKYLDTPHSHYTFRQEEKCRNIAKYAANRKLSAQTRSLGKITKSLQASLRSQTAREISQGNEPSQKRFTFVEEKKDSLLLIRRLVGRSQQANKDFTKASDDICSKLLQLKPYKDSLCRSKNKTKSLKRFLTTHSDIDDDRTYADCRMTEIDGQITAVVSKKPAEATKITTTPGELSTFFQDTDNSPKMNSINASYVIATSAL